MFKLIALFAVAMVAALATDTPTGPIALTGAVVFLCWCYRSDEAGEPLELRVRRVKLTMLCDRNRYKGRGQLWRHRKLGPSYGPAHHWSEEPGWCPMPEPEYFVEFRRKWGKNITANHTA
jgi:hypothetical protein